ncbi:hypothetical protein [Nocardioides sp.]|uniref:hypothetical protein n=1 Tax=Nocardioides sp. TaxID=35761 RepID=UPI00271908C2|nr:hypothetical protein [Nocardioides sp.]MDO9456232.1 hypothetical protein [Nocardioides sp.]
MDFDADEFVEKLLKKALDAALGKVTGMAGSKAESFVLDLFGLSDSDAAQTAAVLQSISDTVTQIDGKVTALLNEVTWSNASQGFDTVWSEVKTHQHHVQVKLQASDQATRDAGVKKYLLEADPRIDALAPNLVLIHDRMMGTGGAAGLEQPTLMETLLATNWELLRDDDPVRTCRNVFQVFARIAEMQRLATSLLVAYYVATDDLDLARDAGSGLAADLAKQYGTVLDALPDFVAVAALPHPRVRAEFTTFTLVPSVVDVDQNLLRVGTVHPSMSWALTRVASSPSAYRLELHFDLPGGQKDVFWGVELPHRVQMADNWVGAPGHEREKLETADIREVRLDPAGGSSTAYEVRPTGTLGDYRMVSPSGGTFTFEDRRDYGMTIEMTNTFPDEPTGLARLGAIVKSPPKEEASVTAWSRAFASKPGGEGRWKPGFRVRYRIVAFNRYGQSPFSGFVAARPEFNPDSDGFFDSGGGYYCPQLLLSNASGRAEAYQVWRQFENDVEEDVTSLGTFNIDDLQSGADIIFDDFAF